MSSTTQKSIRIGIVGTDTSHAVTFAELLNTPSHRHHVPGARISCAYPTSSPDFELSKSRAPIFANRLHKDFSVDLVDSIQQVAEESDAIFIETLDGRVHEEQLDIVAPFGKPIFIDKPFALTSSSAGKMACLAQKYGLPLLSCSALRFAESLQRAMGASKKPFIGADFYGPLAWQSTQPGYFWYGIHAIEMLYAVLKSGCQKVQVFLEKDQDLIVSWWTDGRMGTVRGNPPDNNQFGGSIHEQKSSHPVYIGVEDKPYYASLLEAIIQMIQQGRSPVPINQMIEMIRFIEAANKSRISGNVELV